MKKSTGSLLSSRGFVLLAGVVFVLALGGYFGWSALRGGVDQAYAERDEYGSEEYDAPGAGDDPEGRANWFMYQRMYPFDDVPEGARNAAFEEMKRMEASSRPDGAGATWAPIGPLPTTSAYQANGGFNSGRVNAIAVSPADVQLVLIGAATGGIWRSTNGGTDFVPVSDSQADLGVGGIAFAPSNPNIVYAAMGDVDNNGYFGTGILKSTDAGATWTRINNTSFPAKGNSVAIQVDRLDPNRVYVAQYNSLNAASGGFFSSGIWVSTNGGVAWTRTLTGLASDVVTHPTNRQIIYAGMRFVNGAGELPGLYKSVDAGLTWNRVYDSPYAANSASTREFRVAVSPANPNRVYIYFGTSATAPTQVRVERSDDGGDTWTENGVVPNSTEGLDPMQFGYNTYLAVSPTNSNIVYIGARDVYRSTDGGSTFTNINNSFVGPTNTYTPRLQKFHADQQSFAFQPGNGNIFYCGTDGGVWKTTNFGTSFTSLNSTLSLTQFVGIAVHPTDSTKSYGGTQDNGSQRRTVGTGWTEYSGGDGGKTVINPLNRAMVFSSYVRGSITRWLADGTSFNGKVGDLSVLGEPATGARIAFYPPIVGNGVDSKLYVGTRRLMRCDDCDDSANFIGNNGTRPTWVAPGGNFDQTRGGSDNLSAIAVARSDNSVIYTGSRDGRAMVSVNGGETWSDISTGLPNRSIRSIVVSATNPAIVYLTVSGYASGHVFHSTDSGANWTDISNNLPDIPVSAFLIDQTSTTTLFAGTDIGVFRSTDSGTTWAPFNNGLPPVPVMEFTTQPGGLIQIGTYGRGAYELRPANAPTVNVGNGTAAERGSNAGRPEGEASIDFEVSLTQTSSQPVTVTVSTSSLTAIEGEDFLPIEDLEVVFPPNTLTQIVSIPLIEDTGDEAEETFALDVTGVTNGVVGDAEGIGTILDNDDAPATPRNVRAINVSAQPGSQVLMAVQLDSLGDERSVSFTINFDPARLSNPAVFIGSGAPGGSSVATNTTQAASGRVGIAVASPSTFAAGSSQLVLVRFDVASTAAPGPVPVTFGTSPTGQNVLDSTGASLPTTFLPGSVVLGSTAANVEISGRVLTSDEENPIGVRSAKVTLIGPGGSRRTVTSSSFGIFRFDNLTRGITYTLTATSKRYRFAPKTVVANDASTGVDLVGAE
jgi:photosystem II stability/assembly factor-like uncharacterized protein